MRLKHTATVKRSMDAGVKGALKAMGYVGVVVAGCAFWLNGPYVQSVIALYVLITSIVLVWLAK
jgi:hypothetical protein